MAGFPSGPFTNLPTSGVTVLNTPTQHGCHSEPEGEESRFPRPANASSRDPSCLSMTPLLGHAPHPATGVGSQHLSSADSISRSLERVRRLPHDAFRRPSP